MTWTISARAFITKGPQRATGSRKGALRNGGLTGKFFFSPGPTKGFAPLDKFRMWFPKAKLMITFAV